MPKLNVTFAGVQCDSDNYFIYSLMPQVNIDDMHPLFCSVNLGYTDVGNIGIINIIDEDIMRLSLTYYAIIYTVYKYNNSFMFNRFHCFSHNDNSSRKESHYIEITDSGIYNGTFAIYTKLCDLEHCRLDNLQLYIVSIESFTYLLNLYEQKYGRFIPMPLSKIMSRDTARKVTPYDR